MSVKLKVHDKGENKSGKVFAIATMKNDLTKETGLGVWCINENYKNGKIRKSWACCKNHMRACDAIDLFNKKINGKQR